MKKKPVLIALDDRQVFQDSEVLKKQHDAVQEQIKSFPEEKQKQIRSMQGEVDEAIATENDIHFSDEAFAAEARGREAIKAGSNQPIGKIFQYQGNLLVKTPFNTVLPAQHYVNVLQDQVIGVVTELEDLKKENTRLSNILFDQGDPFLTGKLTFSQLIKLAFKKLFKRGTK